MCYRKEGGIHNRCLQILGLLCIDIKTAEFIHFVWGVMVPVSTLEDIAVGLQELCYLLNCVAAMAVELRGHNP